MELEKLERVKFRKTLHLLAQIYGQHMNALDRAASNGTVAVPMLRPVRSVGVTGQTGSPAKNGEVRRTLAWEGPRQGRRT